jgi:hypothetical protein
MPKGIRPQANPSSGGEASRSMRSGQQTAKRLKHREAEDAEKNGSAPVETKALPFF